MRTRRTRTPKKKSQYDIVKKMVYLKQDTSSGTTSISPTKILGANYLVTYNINTKYFTIFNAPTGLGVHRSSITQVELPKSSMRRMKDPINFAKAVQKCNGINQVKAIFNEKSSGKKITQPDRTRINQHTVLLATF